MIGADLACAERIVAERGMALGRPLHVLSETESTNDDAKRGAKEGAPHGAVWTAEVQTRGRGRQGRAWLSSRGENLLFSVLLRIPCAPVRVPLAALVCGLSVRDAVARAIGVDDAALVKWPNDVLVSGRKIAGVLVESAMSGTRVDYVVCGVGINVHARTLPKDLDGVATSIALERSSRGVCGEIDRAVILADVLESLDRDIEHVLQRGLGIVHARLSRHDALRGREVSVEGATGVAEGIDLDGRLRVRGPDGNARFVASGEVLPRL